jgi:hypothetical protein
MENNSLSKPRPVLVTVLAIFTILGAVFTFGFGLLKEVVPEIAYNDVPLPAWITITTYVLVTGKLVAAILLLRMRKIGFYLYAAFESIAAVLSIIGGKISMEYMDSTYVNPNLPFDPKVLMLFIVGMGIGLSILFIGGYAAHLNKMD